MAYFKCNQITLIEKTASGAVASFSDGIGGVPYSKLEAQIVATQEGTGDPGPDNKRPLHGFTGVNVAKLGVNSFDSAEAGTDTDNLVTATCDGHGKYTLSGTATGGNANITFTLKTPCKITKGMYLHLFNTPYNTVSALSIQRSDNSSITSPTLSPANRILDLSPYIGETIYSIRFYIASNGTVDIEAKPMICLSSTAIPFEEYTEPTNYFVTWQTEAGEIFGGTIDIISGLLTATNGVAVFNGSESGWSYNAANLGFIRTIDTMKSGNAQAGLCDTFKTISSNGAFGVRFGGNNQILYFNHITDNIAEVTDLATWLSWLSTNNVMVIYPLATPQTYQLSATEVLALLGVNNVFNDTNGNTEVTYKAKP